MIKLHEVPPDIYAEHLAHQKTQVARALRLYVRTKGFTYKHGAYLVGCSYNAFGYVMRGEEWKVSFDLIFRMATVFGIKIHIGVTLPQNEVSQ